MCALSPSLLCNFGWPSEDSISHQQNYVCRETETPESLPQQPEIQPDHSASFTAYWCGGDPSMVKKLSHNASERDRRKKINCLYSSLRSLLPQTDQMKKLSISATVSRVVKYIPELQQEVERLVRKKEELLSKISRQDEHLIQQQNQRKVTAMHSFSSATSVHWLSDMEVAIQITSKCNLHKCPLSEILLYLEQDGLFLINSSSLQCIGGQVFYNLHLQVIGTCKVECEALKGKLESLL